MSLHSSYIDCKYNLASNEAEIVCDWCQSMIDFNPREGWSVPLTPTDHERAIALCGGPSVHASGRWKRLAHSLGDGEHANWAKLENEAMEPIIDLPCSEAEFQELGGAIVNGHALSNEITAFVSECIDAGIDVVVGGRLVGDLALEPLDGLSVHATLTSLANAVQALGARSEVA